MFIVSGKRDRVRKGKEKGKNKRERAKKKKEKSRTEKKRHLQCKKENSATHRSIYILSYVLLVSLL